MLRAGTRACGEADQRASPPSRAPERAATLLKGEGDAKTCRRNVMMLIGREVSFLFGREPGL